MSRGEDVRLWRMMNQLLARRRSLKDEHVSRKQMEQSGPDVQVRAGTEQNVL